MSAARVKRGKSPKGKLTEGNYRKKALSPLLRDFEKRCAYCLDPDEFRHPSLNHVDHFNCKIHGRRRHQYKNLMLSCAACNQTKHDKPVVNPSDNSQRLLNCTEENEFPEHVVETDDGQWMGKTPQGEYHLAAIGLQENCHKTKRQARRKMAERILGLLTQAIQYESHNPPGLHKQVMGTVLDTLDVLENFPPMVTENGVKPVREWLAEKGLDVALLANPSVSPKG